MNASKNIWLVILFSVFFAYRARSEVWRTPVVADCNIEGVECRLRPDKVFWFEGEIPLFKVGLRNQGTRRLYVILEPVSWELSIDGKWYHMDLSMLSKLSPFPPGCWYDDINVSISKYWLSNGQLIKKLAPGEHTIQVAYFAHLDNKNFGSPAIRVVSNPVEIKVLPKTLSSPERGVFFQWRFELDKEIPVSLRPKHTIPIYRVWPKTITFHQNKRLAGKGTGTEVEAILKIDGLSTIKAEWRIRIELLDQVGRVLGKAEVVRDLPGRRRWEIFGGGIGRKQYKLHFSFGRQRYINIASVKRFRISFEQVNEKPRTPIEDDGKGAWGKCVSGLQCRLRLEALSYNTGQTIRCKADVRNSGPWDFSIHKTQELCELCIDGQWYRHSNGNEESSPFPWGQEYSDIIITPNTSWYRKNDHTPLELSPGKHIIQVVFGADLGAEKPRPAVWFLSNQVEVEILPDNNN